MTPTQALDAIGEKIGLAGLTFERGHQCDLELEDGMQFAIISSRDEDSLEFVAWIGKSADNMGALKLLMQLNFGGVVPWGGWFALHQRSSELIVCSRLNLADETAQNVAEKFDVFAKSAQHWQKHLPALSNNKTSYLPHDEGQMIRV